MSAVPPVTGANGTIGTIGVRAAYEAELATRGYQSDPAQLRAVAALERCSL